VRPDDGGTGALDYPELRVDLDGIDDFVAALRKEIDGNLSPDVDRLWPPYCSSVPFGQQSKSPNMSAVRRVYYECVVGIRTILDSYVNAGRTLAATAEQIAKQYRDTDAMVAATTTDISQALAEQTKAAPPKVSVSPSSTAASPPPGVGFGEF
jgi:hypothetical protein